MTQERRLLPKKPVIAIDGQLLHLAGKPETKSDFCQRILPHWLIQMAKKGQHFVVLVDRKRRLEIQQLRTAAGHVSEQSIADYLKEVASVNGLSENFFEGKYSIEVLPQNRATDCDQVHERAEDWDTLKTEVSRKIHPQLMVEDKQTPFFVCLSAPQGGYQPIGTAVLFPPKPNNSLSTDRLAIAMLASFYSQAGDYPEYDRYFNGEDGNSYIAVAQCLQAALPRWRHHPWSAKVKHLVDNLLQKGERETYELYDNATVHKKLLDIFHNLDNTQHKALATGKHDPLLKALYACLEITGVRAQREIAYRAEIIRTQDRRLYGFKKDGRAPKLHGWDEEGQKTTTAPLAGKLIDDLRDYIRFEKTRWFKDTFYKLWYGFKALFRGECVWRNPVLEQEEASYDELYDALNFNESNRDVRGVVRHGLENNRERSKFDKVRAKFIVFGRRGELSSGFMRHIATTGEAIHEIECAQQRRIYNAPKAMRHYFDQLKRGQEGSMWSHIKTAIGSVVEDIPPQFTPAEHIYLQKRLAWYEAIPKPDGRELKHMAKLAGYLGQADKAERYWREAAAYGNYEAFKHCQANYEGFTFWAENTVDEFDYLAEILNLSDEGDSVFGTAYLCDAIASFIVEEHKAGTGKRANGLRDFIKQIVETNIFDAALQTHSGQYRAPIDAHKQAYRTYGSYDAFTRYKQGLKLLHDELNSGDKQAEAAAKLRGIYQDVYRRIAEKDSVLGGTVQEDFTNLNAVLEEKANARAAAAPM